VPGSSALTSKSVLNASAFLPHLKAGNPLKALDLAQGPSNSDYTFYEGAGVSGERP
jgi:hypothetical protein